MFPPASYSWKIFYLFLFSSASYYWIYCTVLSVPVLQTAPGNLISLLKLISSLLPPTSRGFTDCSCSLHCPRKLCFANNIDNFDKILSCLLLQILSCLLLQILSCLLLLVDILYLFLFYILPQASCLTSSETFI